MRSNFNGIKIGREPGVHPQDGMVEPPHPKADFAGGEVEYARALSERTAKAVAAVK